MKIKLNYWSPQTIVLLLIYLIIGKLLKQILLNYLIFFWLLKFPIPKYNIFIIAG